MSDQKDEPPKKGRTKKRQPKPGDYIYYQGNKIGMLKYISGTGWFLEIKLKTKYVLLPIYNIEEYTALIEG